MILILWVVSIITSCFIYSTMVIAAAGDVLVINGDLVNVRQAPTINADVVFRLAKGDKVIQIQRQDDWVEIGIYRKNKKTGWIHQSLLGEQESDPDIVPTSVNDLENDSSVIAGTGSELTVIRDRVNVMKTPSTNAAVVFSLVKGDKVIEIQRQYDWVEIGTYDNSRKTGWVHQSLLGMINIYRNTSSLTHFNKFMEQFNAQNENIKMQNGVIYFSKVNYKGQGQLEAIATEALVNSTTEVRKQLISEIFKLWSDISPAGSSISVLVLDEQGDKYILMQR